MAESEPTHLNLPESLKPIAFGDLEDYVLKSKVGEGPFSTVWRAEQKSNGREVALKQIHLSKLSPQLRDCLRCELSFLSSVNHPNIIRLLNVFQQNIFLSGPENRPVLKIADFGLSRMVNPGEFVETVCGSPLYMAPEILQFQRYNEKVLQKITSCKCVPFSQLILPQLDPDCVDMCSRLLCTDPVNRLSFDEFYLHMFLRRKSKRVVKDVSSNSPAVWSYS